MHLDYIVLASFLHLYIQVHGPIYICNSNTAHTLHKAILLYTDSVLAPMSAIQDDKMTDDDDAPRHLCLLVNNDICDWTNTKMYSTKRNQEQINCRIIVGCAECPTAIFITIFVPQTHHTLCPTKEEFSTIRTIKPMDDPTSDDGAKMKCMGKFWYNITKIVAHGRDILGFYLLRF